MFELTVSLPIRMALIEADGLHVTCADEAARKLAECAASYGSRYGDTSAGEVAGVQTARDLFRALNIDPTRRRPSSEALLRRALKDMPLPAVNTLVDVGNWCSLDFLLPLGIYDAAEIVGSVVLRAGEDGEGYEAIGDKVMNLAGRYLLADEIGPFGSPMTDSKRTSVTEETSRTAVFIYAPLDYEPALLHGHAETMAQRIIEVCGGSSTGVAVVAGGS